MRLGSPKNFAMCWGSEPPVWSLGYAAERVFEGDSGFTVIFEDAPAPGEVRENDPRITWVCLHCLIEERPEIGRGLDLAREYGAADVDESGEWQGRSLTEDPA